MRAKVTMTEDEVRLAIVEYIHSELAIRLKPTDIILYVKSKQNYKSEWEHANIKVEFESVPIPDPAEQE